MCLNLDKSAAVQRAPRGKSIVAYKVIRKHTQGSAAALANKFGAIFHVVPYTRGELKRVGAFAEQSSSAAVEFTSALPANLWSVGKGLHTFVNLDDAMKCADSWGVTRIVVECKIPRRTLYIYGRDDVRRPSYASLQLKVGKAIYGHPQLVAEFNATLNRKKGNSDGKTTT